MAKYGSVIWNPLMAHTFNKLELVDQRRFPKIIKYTFNINCPPCDYIRPVICFLNHSSLTNRRHSNNITCLRKRHSFSHKSILKSQSEIPAIIPTSLLTTQPTT